MVNLRNKAGSSVSSFWELSCINKVFVIERQEEYEYKRMSKEIYRAIGTLDKKLSLLTRDEILNEMGFPQNWRNLNSL